MKKWFEIGQVAGGHGLKGELKVYPISDNPDNLLRLKYYYMNGCEYKVLTAKKSGKFIVLGLEGINTREEADSLRNIMISIKRENAAPLSKGQVYIEDIIGCEAYEDGTFIGTVSDVMKTGANDVYVIECKDGKEILIPAIKDVVKEVDIEKRRIDVLVPEGLIENADF